MPRIAAAMNRRLDGFLGSTGDVDESTGRLPDRDEAPLGKLREALPGNNGR